ncbi:Omp28-related outer membrane protein [uncultured Alistipes sp.]|uniref:Omp28-related outer membrane protein n=1 Tax=uncultured Alistipes sp. TaxID=538949 RepID=UPI00262680EF|nr:Omp28-related outer membrane protein [uncultured Alistipes sp.]
MKKFFYIAAAALVGMGTACSGNGGDEPVGPDGDITALTLTLLEDTIEADGVTPLKYKVEDQDGNDVTDYDKLRMQNISENGVNIDIPVTFVENGEVVLRVKDISSGVVSNNVTVKVQNRGKYEKYFRRSLIYDMTDVLCSNCPTLAKGLKNQCDKYPDRLLIVAVHGGFSTSDPFVTPATNQLLSMWSINSWPSAIIDMRAKVGNDAASAGKFARESWRLYPATSGIKLKSSMADNKVTISAEVAIEEDGVYSFGYGVLTDGIPYEQSGAGVEYKHEDILMALSNHMGGWVGDDNGQMKKGDKWNFETTFDFANKYSTAENSRLFAFVMKKTANDKFYINNVADCPINGEVDYKLND